MTPADEGYSGANTLRPGFHNMLEDVAAGRIQAVVCYRLDRISRSVSDFSGILQYFNEHNIAFLSVKEHFDTSTPMGRAMLYISSVFAQLERETIAERLQDNLRRLAQTGRWLGGIPPLGFDAKREKQTEGRIDRSYCLLVPNPSEQEIVTQLFSQYINLKSLSKVSEYAKRMGYQTRKHNSFCARTLRHILSNPVYVKSAPSIYQYYSEMGCTIASSSEQFSGNGIHISGKYEKKQKKLLSQPPSHWTIAVGFHEGLIDADLFLKVQQLLNKNRKKPSRIQSSQTALLSGLLVCPRCGSPMFVSYKTSSNPDIPVHYYYRCRNKTKSRGQLCNMENINGKTADTLALAAVEKYLRDNYTLFLNMLFTSMKSEQYTLKPHHDSIIKTKEKIKNLSKCLADNVDSSASKFILLQIEEYAKSLSILEAAEHTSNTIAFQNASLHLQKIYEILDFVFSPNKWSLEDQKRFFSCLSIKVQPHDQILLLNTQ